MDVKDLTTSGKPSTFDPDAYPAEVWSHILDFVVPNPILGDSDPSYRPFKATTMRDRDWKASVSQARSLSTLCQLVLVCKRWHVWLSRRLYSCLRIHHGTQALLEGLVRRRDQRLVAAARGDGGDEEKDGRVVEEDTFQVDYTSFVRAIQVHHDPVDFDPFNPLPLCEIITLCASTVEYFIRPYLSQSGGALLQLPKVAKAAQSGSSKDDPNAYMPYPFPALPNLRCIDWYNAGSIKNHRDISSFLAALIAASSRAEGGLETLTYSDAKVAGYTPWSLNNPAPLPVHTSLSLKTLRLEHEPDTMRLFTFDLPNLENIVISQPHHATNPTVSSAGTRIKRLEVTDYPYTDNAEAVETIWRTMPNLEEINMSILALMTFAEMYDSSPGKGTGVKWAKVRILRINYCDLGVGLILTLGLSGRMPGPLLVAFLKDKLNLGVFESVVLYGSEGDWRTDTNTGFGPLEVYIKSLLNVTLEFTR